MAEKASFRYSKLPLSAERTLCTASKPYLEDLVTLRGPPEQPNRHNFALWDTVIPADFPLHLGGSCLSSSGVLPLFGIKDF